MKQWFRGGANNAPHHASGTRATDRALSHTRSLTAAAVAVAMMATVAVTALLPTYNAKARHFRHSWHLHAENSPAWRSGRHFVS